MDSVKGKLNLVYYAPENQEDRDVKGLEYVMKKYNRILKLYYGMYSGHHRAKNLDSFDQIAEKYNLLYSAGLIRMVKENTLDEFLTVRQIQTICKKINHMSNK